MSGIQNYTLHKHLYHYQNNQPYIGNYSHYYLITYYPLMNNLYKMSGFLMMNSSDKNSDKKDTRNMLYLCTFFMDKYHSKEQK